LGSAKEISYYSCGECKKNLKILHISAEQTGRFKTMPPGVTTPIMSTLPDLTAIRKLKGISLESIAGSTKISKRYLEAIERSEFGQLPGGVFSTSYIRQYARAIDYDEWDLLANFASALEPGETPPPAESSRRRKLLGVLKVPQPLVRLFAPEKRA
jgi:transcriptional regulator with XRE-family HTH domain